MTPITCRECLRARQLVVHLVYEEECIGCGVRRLAYQVDEQRERFLDTLQFLYGDGARREVARMVLEERARIQALKQMQCAGQVTWARR